MLQILNLLSNFAEPGVLVVGPEVGDLECHVLVPVVFVFLPPFWMFTKECGLEFDYSRVQERACAKEGSTLCRSTCVVLYSKTCTWVVITCCESWRKHVKSRATTVYFSI